MTSHSIRTWLACLLFGFAASFLAASAGAQDFSAPSSIPPQAAANEGPIAELARMPAVTPASNARVNELEQRLAELETRLDAKDEKPAGAAGEGYEVGSDLGMSAKWNHGVEFSSKNKDFKIHVGGRTQVDAVGLWSEPGALAGAGGVGDQDAVDFRRARLRIDGTIYEFYEFAAEYDLMNTVNDDPTAGGTENNVINVPAPTDLWWSFKEVPYFQNIRVGNMKEPIGLEHMTSSRFLDFMERSFNQDLFTGAFNNGFSPGIMAYDTIWDERGAWAIGLFKNTANVFAYNTGDGEGALTGRFTYLPYYDEPTKGRYLWHVGVAGSVRDPDQDRVRFRSRGSLRNGPGSLNPVFVDSGFVTCQQQTMFGLESAVVWGPWLFQGEFIGSNLIDAVGNGNGAPIGTPIGNPFVYGYYVEAMYFLTGEHREYESRAGGGAFGRVIPLENAYLIGHDGCRFFSRGAWQLGLRYSHADVSDLGLDGGIVQDVTLGLNWFLNPNMKWQFNYIYCHRDARNSTNNGDIDGIGVRFAHDF